MMKRWKTIPAWLALIALLLPCSHLIGHEHDDCAPTACAAVHEDCTACEETVCSDKAEILPLSAISAAILPAPNRVLLYRIQCPEKVEEPLLLPPAALLPIETIQLLI